MKKGRFSGKNTSKRSLIVTWGSSDSTWLKSGLTVASSVSASRITPLKSSPTRRSLAVRNAGEAQIAERDRKPHHVAVRSRAAVRLPDGVEAVVVVLPFRHEGVGLNAERVRQKQVGVLAVAKRVEVHGDGVVRSGLLPLGERGADQRRGVLADEHDVQVGVVVGHVGGGRRARRIAVAGIALAEI